MDFHRLSRTEGLDPPLPTEKKSSAAHRFPRLPSANPRYRPGEGRPRLPGETDQDMAPRSISIPMNAATELARELVRIPTFNPPGNELPAMELLECRLSAAGFETTVVPYGEGRGHLVARLRGRGRRPGLLFSGHVDVVPVGGVPWSVDPFAGEIREGRLYGRGACDMKGGTAALAIAAEAVARSGLELEGDLVFAATSDEENGCSGAEALAREPLFDGIGAALIAEPSRLEPILAEKGACWLEVTFLGKTAHASMPEQGANAVAAAAEFIGRVEREPPVAGAEHPVLGPATQNIGTIQGGVRPNVVPDRCVVTLDVRSVPGLSHAAVRERVERIADHVSAARPGTRWETRVLIDRGPVASPADSDLARAVCDLLEADRGARPVPAGVPYFTEACIWVPVLGIPMVICGPGNPQLAHQPDEHVEVEDLEAAARLYARVAERVLGGTE